MQNPQRKPQKDGRKQHEPPPINPPDAPELPPVPNESEPEAPPERRRIPHFGHAVAFASFAGFLLIVFEILLAALGKSPAAIKNGVIAVEHPMLQLAALAGTYLLTLLAAWFFFPALWRPSFLDGIQWHWSTARSQAARLIGLGLLLGIMMQIVTTFITPPKSLPVDQFFLTPLSAWAITLFGTIVAPVFEEICFRGFLFPAFAIAYDWLGMPRTDEARLHWRTTTSLTTSSLWFSGILTSLCFALLHADQVANIGAALLGLFAVSLVLTWVRVQTQSVAASAMVHAAYNGFVFLTVLVATGGFRHLDRMPH